MTLQSQNSAPSIVCPRCSGNIPITLTRLLSGLPHICECCRMELRVDADQSRQSLDIVRDLTQNQIDKFGR